MKLCTALSVLAFTLVSCSPRSFNTGAETKDIVNPNDEFAELRLKYGAQGNELRADRLPPNAPEFLPTAAFGFATYGNNSTIMLDIGERTPAGTRSLAIKHVPNVGTPGAWRNWSFPEACQQPNLAGPITCKWQKIGRTAGEALIDIPQGQWLVTVPTYSPRVWVKGRTRFGIMGIEVDRPATWFSGGDL